MQKNWKKIVRFERVTFSILAARPRLIAFHSYELYNMIHENFNQWFFVNY